jgi:hypothetical protein
MKIGFNVAGEDVAVIEVWDDKVPELAAKIRAALPFSTYLQHGKLTGDLLLMQTKILADWENMFYPEDLAAMATDGGEPLEASGTVSYYGPRQQISIMYGNDIPPEPLPVSGIGRVIEGAENLEKIGMKTWIEPGMKVWLTLLED